MAHDPRRRYYVVSVMRHPHETNEQCDDRILRRLQVDDTARVTLTVYDVALNEFRKLKPATDG